MNEKFPNEAKFRPGQQRSNPDNHFEGRELDEVRRRYVKFTVLMEYLNDVLELGRHTDLDTFANRIRDLVIASNKGEDPVQQAMPTKEELEQPEIVDF